MRRMTVVLVLACGVIFAFSKSKKPEPLNGEQKARLERLKAQTQLKQRDPDIQISFDSTGCVRLLDGNLSDPSRKPAREIVFDFLNKYKALFCVENPADEFVVADSIPDELGLIHFKIQQVWRMVPIWGAQLNVHLRPNGQIYYIAANIVPSPQINIIPRLTEQDGVKSAKQHYLDNGGSPVKKANAELMIYTADGKSFKLAWHIKILGENLLDGWEYFVDANTGEILYRITTIRFDGPVTGSGTDLLGVNRTLNLYQMGGSYKTIDVTKPMYAPPVENLRGVIATFDFNHSESEGSIYTSGSSNVSDRAIVSGHWVFGDIYDFYRNLVNRNSWDNEGMTIRIGIHFGTNYNNAFWAGAENNFFCFGDGDGSRFSGLAGGYDIACHEFQHAVTEASAGLVYHNQQGALNEAYSDIAGSVYDPDWLIGEDITTPSVPGDALRYMNNPHMAELPAHMSEFVYLPDNQEGDWGGVHINMSIPCLAYVRMVDGEPHFTRNDAFKVWYRALVTYLNANSDFMNCRTAVLQSAQDIYGSTPEWTNIECGIKNAFASVGLGADCSGGGGGEWEGDYLYYWNPDADSYYVWTLPAPYYDIFGYAVKFTMPAGYNLAGVFAGVFDVFTLADMFMGIYNSGLSLVHGDTIENDELWTAVYGGGSGVDTASYIVGIIAGSPCSGDFYVATWLTGSYDPYVEYIVLASDDASGNTQERNYTLDSYGNLSPIRNWGAEYNLVFFAAITRQASAGETAYLLSDGRIFDVHAYPTPFNNMISINYSIPGEGKINITDVSGRLVQCFDNLSGNGTLTWCADNNLPAGIYFVNAHSNSLPLSLTRKIVYIK